MVESAKDDFFQCYVDILTKFPKRKKILLNMNVFRFKINEYCRYFYYICKKVQFFVLL